MIGIFLKQGFTVLQHIYYTTIKGGAWAGTTLKCEIGAGGVVLQESINSCYCYPHTDLIFHNSEAVVGYKLHLPKSKAGLCG